MLLDDLLVADDLAAGETTSTASHAPGAAGTTATNAQAARSPRGFTYADERMRQSSPDAVSDSPIVVGVPVAPPVNGDMNTDISPENAILQGQR